MTQAMLMEYSTIVFSQLHEAKALLTTFRIKPKSMLYHSNVLTTIQKNLTEQ